MQINIEGKSPTGYPWDFPSAVTLSTYLLLSKYFHPMWSFQLTSEASEAFPKWVIIRSITTEWVVWQYITSNYFITLVAVLETRKFGDFSLARDRFKLLFLLATNHYAVPTQQWRMYITLHRTTRHKSHDLQKTRSYKNGSEPVLGTFVSYEYAPS